MLLTHVHYYIRVLEPEARRNEIRAISEIKTSRVGRSGKRKAESARSHKTFYFLIT